MRSWKILWRTCTLYERRQNAAARHGGHLALDAGSRRGRRGGSAERPLSIGRDQGGHPDPVHCLRPRGAGADPDAPLGMGACPGRGLLLHVFRVLQPFSLPPATMAVHEHHQPGFLSLSGTPGGDRAATLDDTIEAACLTSSRSTKVHAVPLPSPLGSRHARRWAKITMS